ncbi:MAG TPA: M20/M25/M40 family metallo-hydrolase, partial [Desulfurococcaceae archaeon]|nr:M20/M25/M40 family metallo-hydrolase [Desulfurococcaceae archaeon]
MLNASMKNLAVKLLLELLRTYSPTFNEDKAVKLLYDYAHKLDYDNVEIDSVGNLVAKIGRGSCRILLISHIDTVEGYIQPGFDGYRFYGRGAVDAKGPLAAMLIATSLARRYIDFDKTSVHVIAAVGEEGPSHGAKHLIDIGVKYDSVIVGEPTNLVNVVIGCRGNCRVVIECQGSGGHSSSPWLYESACENLIKSWIRIKSLFNGVTASEFSTALLKMMCGSNTNTIPRHGVAVVSIRIPIGKSSTDIKSMLRNIELEKGCNIRIEECTEPVKVSVNNLSVRALNRALIGLGLKPKVAIKLGTSDMNILYGRVTTDIAEWGPGRSELSHSNH